MEAHEDGDLQVSCQSGPGDVVRLDNSCCWWRWTRNVQAGSTIGSGGGVDGQRNARWRSTPNEGGAHGAVRRWEDDGRWKMLLSRAQESTDGCGGGGGGRERETRIAATGGLLSLCFESGGTQVGRGGCLRVHELALLFVSV